MSEGIRSGVNWIRLKPTSRILASVLTISVLARPGTPSSKQWPRVKMAANNLLDHLVLADDDLLQLLLHHPAVLAEFLQHVAQAARFGGRQRKSLSK